MFGKTKDTEEQHGDLAIDQFFGDEDGAAEAASLEVLQDRVEHVEQQLSSQFTSLAAYAQIAQEQIELARAESRCETERTESRLMQLIERERSERLGMATPGIDASSVGAADERLDDLEAAVEMMKVGISDCLSRQKALADAITALFQPAADAECAATLPPPPNIDGPIGGLALDG